jgi:thiamine pyrophosphokinase
MRILAGFWTRYAHRHHAYIPSDLFQGEHEIEIDHDILGQTCGLLPVGIDKTTLSTRGLRWNLTETESSFDGLVSTSNHLVPDQNVWIKTTKPIWWTMELKNIH